MKEQSVDATTSLRAKFQTTDTTHKTPRSLGFYIQFAVAWVWVRPAIGSDIANKRLDCASTSLTRLQLAQGEAICYLPRLSNISLSRKSYFLSLVAFPATLDLVDVVRSLRLPENSNDPGQPQGFWPVNIWAKLRETRFCPANTQL